MAKKENKTKTAPTSGGQVIRVEYSELMQQSYIDYAMSVIVARALPDIRDGLKPVQRRTLYDMYELGIRSDRPYRKCARIVGDTMGKYHPHGDSSIYDALVVMAQDFKKEVPLVDGHGNFGNVEGDGAAAMRYTEARLRKITEDALLGDLDKDVIDFIPNFDETEKEPAVLPAKIPNFLINGSEGIAVGMATNTPPHNLGEVIDAEIALLEKPEMTTAELMRFLPGPDFPTGGIVVNKDELPQIYETGTGRIRIRGKTEVEKGHAGHINLVVTEIPYTMIGSGIGKFLSDVAALAENKITSDVLDITNQSSKEGIRIVIELRKDTDVDNFRNLLYKKTRLEDTFGVNMLAIVDNRPETLGLKRILQENIRFQYETNQRKYQNLLEKEKERREVQEGLIKAVSVIDLIIEILRGARDRATVKRCMVTGETKGIRFKSKESEVMASQLHFTERQADAILDMRLYKLIGLEIDALMKEHEETLAHIYEYEDILENRESMTRVIRDELMQLRREYAQPRRTTIEQGQEITFVVRADEKIRDLVFVADRFGYAKTLEMTTYERNKEAVERDYRYHFVCRSNGKICLFTDACRLHTIRVEDLPAGRLRDKGVPLDNVSNFDSSKENILFATSLKLLENHRVLFVTAEAMCKQVDGNEFNVSRKTIASTRLSEGDTLVYTGLIDEEDQIVLRTKKGFFLKFPLGQIPEKKKTAIGVRGMKLSQDDRVEEAYLLRNGQEQSVTKDKTTVDLHRLRLSSRDGKGTKRL